MYNVIPRAASKKKLHKEIHSKPLQINKNWIIKNVQISHRKAEKSKQRKEKQWEQRENKKLNGRIEPFHIAMNWIMSLRSYIKALTSNVFGDRASVETTRVNEVVRVGPWSDRISALIRRNTRRNTRKATSPIWNTTKHAGTPISDFQTPEIQ